MRKDCPLLIPHPSSLLPQRRPVALRRSLFRGVAASIRKQLRAASAAWQPCGRRRVDFLRLGPALCVPAFRRVCLFGPGTEEQSSAPLQDTGRRGAELSTQRWKASPTLGGTAGLRNGAGPSTRSWRSARPPLCWLERGVDPPCYGVARNRTTPLWRESCRTLARGVVPGAVGALAHRSAPAREPQRFLLPQKEKT